MEYSTKIKRSLFDFPAKITLNDKGVQRNKRMLEWSNVSGVMSSMIDNKVLGMTGNKEFAIFLKDKNRKLPMNLSIIVAFGINADEAQFKYTKMMEVIREQVHKPMLNNLTDELNAGKTVDFDNKIVASIKGIEPARKGGSQAMIQWEDLHATIVGQNIIWSKKSTNESFATPRFFWNAEILLEYLYVRQNENQ